MQNFSEHQILWSLCSVDFHTLTLQLLIETPHSVALNSKFLWVHWKTVQISGKRAHPGCTILVYFISDKFLSSSSKCHCSLNYCWHFGKRLKYPKMGDMDRRVNTQFLWLGLKVLIWKLCGMKHFKSVRMRQLDPLCQSVHGFRKNRF